MKLFNREPKPVTYIGPAVPSVTRTVTKTLLAGIGLGGAAVGAALAGDRFIAWHVRAAPGAANHG